MDERSSLNGRTREPKGYNMNENAVIQIGIVAAQHAGKIAIAVAAVYVSAILGGFAAVTIMVTDFFRLLRTLIIENARVKIAALNSPVRVLGRKKE